MRGIKKTRPTLQDDDYQEWATPNTGMEFLAWKDGGLKEKKDSLYFESDYVTKRRQVMATDESLRSFLATNAKG